MLQFVYPLIIYVVPMTFSTPDNKYCGEYAGFYLNGTNIIYICEDFKNQNWLYYHEIGHYYYQNILSEERKQFWDGLLISGQDKEENFARTFSEYWVCRENKTKSKCLENFLFYF